MQRVITRESRHTKPAAHFSNKRQPVKRNSKSKKSSYSDTGTFDFLNQTITNSSVDYMTIEHYTHKNVITEENYSFLLSSAKNYASLIGKKFNHRRKNGLRMSIKDLYDKFSEIVPHHVNIEYDGDRLIFMLYEPALEWEYWRLYWIPLKFVKKLRGTLKKNRNNLSD